MQEEQQPPQAARPAGEGAQAASGIMISCEQATRLAVRREFESLSWGERLRYRLHMLICKACRRFRHQSRVLNQLLEEGWNEPPAHPHTPMPQPAKEELRRWWQRKRNA